jgi:hypothetical protein
MLSLAVKVTKTSFVCGSILGGLPPDATDCCIAKHAALWSKKSAGKDNANE